MRAMKILNEIKATFRESGLRGVSKKYGWKLFLAFFMYYLVRDVVLYILLPYLIYQGVFT